ncbi:hypothetical protein JCM11491_002122 [Sporobolomyces phaffii]
MADKKQAVVTALRGLAHSFGELSKAQRAAQSAIHEYSVELEHSDAPQQILQNFPPLFGDLESLTTAKGKPLSAKAKAAAAAGEDGVDGEDGKKKRAPAKEKKVKDPNAPKRPASAYIEYQNHVRDDFRERHNDLPYAEVLKKIGESWASMTDDQKHPYHEIMERKKTTYLSDKKAYEAEHGLPQSAPASAAASGEPKEYTGKKRGRKSNAERALIAAAAATDAGRAETAASTSKQQADIPVDAPSKKVRKRSSPSRVGSFQSTFTDEFSPRSSRQAVEESDDDSDDSDDDSDDDSTSDEESSDEEPTPPPVVVPPKKDKKVKVADKHKAKKPKTAA